jgi:hypothetical protein
MAAPKVTSKPPQKATKRTVSESALLRRLKSLEEQCAAAHFSANRAASSAEHAVNLMLEIKAQHDLMLRVYNELRPGLQRAAAWASIVKQYPVLKTIKTDNEP